MKSYFVSDLHLGSAKEPNAAVFQRFLRRLADVAGAGANIKLFLVGDIFDLWVANHVYFKRKFQTVWEPLRELRQRGVEIHYFEGNHDLYLKDFFEDFLGLTVHRQAAYYEIDGRTVRVEHGDQMDPDDKGYLFLRWFLRTPFMEFVAPRLPDAAVVRIGERASSMSREYTSTRKAATQEAIFDKIRAHVRKAYAERPFDLFVSGHVHVLFDETIEVAADSSGDPRTVRAVNLGTWLEKPTVFSMSANNMKFIDPRSNLPD